MRYYWCIFCCGIRCENILSLFQTFNQKLVQKNHWRQIDDDDDDDAKDDKMLTCFWVLAFKNMSSLQHSIILLFDWQLVAKSQVFSTRIKSEWFTKAVLCEHYCLFWLTDGRVKLWVYGLMAAGFVVILLLIIMSFLLWWDWFLHGCISLMFFIWLYHSLSSHIIKQSGS